MTVAIVGLLADIDTPFLTLRPGQRATSERIVHGLRSAARQFDAHINTLITEVPASSHPNDVRSGGEGGTTPALALVINAIVDALSDFGIKHIEMPATPQRVWRAIEAARRG